MYNGIIILKVLRAKCITRIYPDIVMCWIYVYIMPTKTTFGIRNRKHACRLKTV